MKKDRINFKLLNLLIIIAIVVLIYLIKGLWLGVVGKIFEIIFPFLIAFGVAYALYPLVVKLQKKGLPKWLSIAIVCFLGIAFIASIVILIVPLLYDQTLLFLSNISAFVSDIATKYEINLGVLQSSISDISTDIIKSLGTYISDGAINLVNASIGVITSLIIIIFAAVYFLIDMEKIRNGVKDNLRSRKKYYNYVKTLDEEVSMYFVGLGRNIIIQLIEYTTIFFLIGHPNYLILGILASFTTIIPYFGGLIVNILALLIASVISTKLFILTLIVCIVCPQIDGYIIGPKVYGKTNRLHPLVNIFAVFAGGILWGFWGIVVSLPIAITLITTYKYFKKDISGKIEELKENKTSKVK